MRKPLTVTLSVVCTLKGMLRQSIQKIEAMLLCIEYDILFVNMKIKASNAFNAMFVDTVNTGVCGSYTTPYAGVKTLHKVASCPCQEGRLLYCVSLPSWGFSCSPVSPRRQLCKLSWTCQTTRVIAGKMHSQSPILKRYVGAQQPSNSYISRGTKLHPPHSNRTCHKQII